MPWPNASATPRYHHPGAASAGMSPRFAASCGRPPIQGWPIVAAPAQRQRADVNPPYSPWALARVSSQLPRKSGSPCRCQPSLVRRPLKRPKAVWIATCKWPAAIIRPMSTYCVGSSVVASVGSRAAAAPYTPATIITSVEAAPIHCGWPKASAARPAMPRRKPWTHWSGRTSAVS